MLESRQYLEFLVDVDLLLEMANLSVPFKLKSGISKWIRAVCNEKDRRLPLPTSTEAAQVAFSRKG